MMRRFPELRDLCDYCIARSNYKFKDAYSIMDKMDARPKGYLKECSKRLKDMQNCIDNRTYKNVLPYDDGASPFVLYESLDNAEFYYHKGEYFVSIAFFTAFIDLVRVYFICKALGIQLSFAPESQYYQYVKEKNVKEKKDLDSLIKEKVENDPILNEICHNDIKELDNTMNGKKKSGKEKLGRVISILNKFPYNKIRLDKEVLAGFTKLYCEQKSFHKLGNLRNSLPVAHSAQGISKDDINRCMEDVSKNGGDTYLAVLKRLKTLLIQMKPSLNGSGTFRTSCEEYIKQLALPSIGH